jgi:hypothetical protein
MPRPRRQPAPAPTLNPGQASYVLERLLSERRVSAGDLNRYVSEMQREISDLESRLTRLREAHGGSSSASSSGSGSPAPARRGRPPGRPPGRPAGRPPGRPPGRPGRPPGRPSANAGTDGGGAGEGQQQPAKRGRKAGARKATLSSEQLASRQLQGRYLALVRQFPPARRLQFARTAKDKGREQAIREMQDSLKK